jgi:cytochrome o ubiquinol oxidase subunit II
MLTSATVMNAFFVPQLGSQIYTMPGMTTRLNLLAERPGNYPRLSSNFSGDGFSDMRFLVSAVLVDEFQGWLSRTQRGGTALDARTYAELARAASNTPTQTYYSVDPNLFETIVQSRSNGMDAPTRNGIECAKVEVL